MSHRASCRHMNKVHVSFSAKAGKALKWNPRHGGKEKWSDKTTAAKGQPGQNPTTNHRHEINKQHNIKKQMGTENFWACLQNKAKVKVKVYLYSIIKNNNCCPNCCTGLKWNNKNE